MCFSPFARHYLKIDCVSLTCSIVCEVMALVSDLTAFPFSAEAVRQRARQRLSGHVPAMLPSRGDYDLNPELIESAREEAPKLRPAAVLIPVLDRGDEARLLFTQRTAHLSAHAGQISFPGGKIDPGDEDARNAALREAREEVGLQSHHVEVIGQLDSYQTGTGFHIHPILGIVSGEAEFQRNENEVSEYFEVPLRHLMTIDNFEKHDRVWRGRPRKFYAISYETRFIWGATAGILRNLFERLYSEERLTSDGAGCPT